MVCNMIAVTELLFFAARVVKQVDTRDLKSLGLTAVPVRLRPRAPFLL